MGLHAAPCDGPCMMSSAILLMVGGRAVIGGSISLGQYVAFASYLAMLTWPMMAIGWVVNLLQRGAASMGRLEKIMNTRPDITDGPVEGEPEPAIEVKDLSFTYPGTETPGIEQHILQYPRFLHPWHSGPDRQRKDHPHRASDEALRPS